MTDAILSEQLAYYRARAGEYDDWFYRRHRYDRGAELNARWLAEAEIARVALRALGPVDSALELACGTGIWTEELASVAESVVAVDGSPEVLALNCQRLHSDRVIYCEADLFTWEPPNEFDLVVFCFWLSHVPDERLDAFLDKVRRATRPGGRFFLVDSRNESTSMAKNHDRPTAETGVRVRKLNDGREFRVVKLFHSPDVLAARFRQHGFDADLNVTPNYFLYGSGVRR